MVSAKLRIHSAAESRFEAENLEKYCVFEGTNHDASIFTCKCGQHWPMWANKPNVSRCGATWGKYEKNYPSVTLTRSFFLPRLARLGSLSFLLFVLFIHLGTHLFCIYLLKRTSKQSTQVAKSAISK